jgi:hypothetical protein
MKADPQLRRRSATDTRTATLSAWVMSIVFAGIAVISFAVDQSVMTSAPFGEPGTELHATTLDQPVPVFGPLRLIETLVGRASDPADEAR